MNETDRLREVNRALAERAEIITKQYYANGGMLILDEVLAALGATRGESGKTISCSTTTVELVVTGWKEIGADWEKGKE